MPVVGGQGQGQRRRARPGADHRVVDAAAHPLVDERGAERGLEVLGSGRHRRRPSEHTRTSARIHAMLLHAERDGAGPPLVLVHGFTQTGRCWGPVADAWPPTTRWSASTRRATAARRDVRPTCRDGRPAASPTRAARPPTSATRWARRLACTSPSTDPELVRGLVLLGGTAGHRGRRPSGRRAGSRTWRTAGRIERDGRRRLPRRLAGPAAVRRAAARAAVPTPSAGENTVDGPGVEPRAGRHRRAGAAVGRSSPRSTCPCWCWPASDDAKFAALADAHGRRDRRQRHAGARRRRRPRRPPRAARRASSPSSGRGSPTTASEPDALRR